MEGDVIPSLLFCNREEDCVMSELMRRHDVKMEEDGMKTLDEQIRRLETAESYLPEVEPWKMLRNDDLTDTLQYLREWKGYQGHMEVVDQIHKDAIRQRDLHIKALADLKRKEKEGKDPERTSAAPWNPDRNRYCCDSCGAYIGKYDKYCNGCGARLTDWTPDGRGKRK